jgi:diguanylate cyclase (GGDEF)-like protein/PAS domain S-box-containing protein
VSTVALPTRQLALERLMAPGRDALVAAIADNGFCVPLPDAFPLDGQPALELPDERMTMLDVVVAADRMPVVAAWERVRKEGISAVSVHAQRDPSTRLTLSMIDLRDCYGVYIGLLSHDDQDGSGSSPELLYGPLVAPTRPRQATLHKSMTAVITQVDDNATRMFGWTPEQMLGARSTEFIHPEDQDRAVSSWMHMLSTLASQRVRLRHSCADGSWLWIEVEHVHNGAESMDDVDVVAHISDISDEMAAHEALRRREQLFSRLADSLPTGVMQLSGDGSIAYANSRLSAILGTSPDATPDQVLEKIVPNDRPAVQAAVTAALKRGEDATLEVAARPGGRRRRVRCSVTIASVADADGMQGALICVTDVTESVQLREELRIRATRDPLTGCLNRAAVLYSLGRLLEMDAGGGVAVVFVDIDNFKPINDRCGHAAGDELLVHVVRRLQKLCRKHDLVGRLGGDEFVLLCSAVAVREEATRIAGRVREALNQPVPLTAGEVDLRASIGVAWPGPETSAETLIAQADAAMYESKREGGGRPVFFADLEHHAA